jgi:hypothetical protein
MQCSTGKRSPDMTVVALSHVAVTYLQMLWPQLVTRSCMSMPVACVFISKPL